VEDWRISILSLQPWHQSSRRRLRADTYFRDFLRLSDVPNVEKSDIIIAGHQFGWCLKNGYVNIVVVTLVPCRRPALPQIDRYVTHPGAVNTWIKSHLIYSQEQPGWICRSTSRPHRIYYVTRGHEQGILIWINFARNHNQKTRRIKFVCCVARRIGLKEENDGLV